MRTDGVRHGRIRSYQRVFSPQRRIHQIEGRSLPVPGGVPLRWLAWTIGALVVVVALSTGSVAVCLAAAGAAALVGHRLGGRTAAALAALLALGGTWTLGFALGLLDWPLRLVVVPAAIGTLATQATPDGRRAERFAFSWSALRLSPRRRSLGRPVPLAGVPRRVAGEVWVAPDEHCAVLRSARVRGAARARFEIPVVLRRSVLRRRWLVARPADLGSGAPVRVALDEGEGLEVRP